MALDSVQNNNNVNFVLPESGAVFMEDSLNKVNRKIDMSFGELKTCTKCECVKKRATDFSLDITKKDGLNSWCRACASDYSRNLPRRAMTAHQYKAWRRKQCLEKIAFWQNELEINEGGVQTRKFRQPEPREFLPAGNQRICK
jgi:hypothetical protein